MAIELDKVFQNIENDIVNSKAVEMKKKLVDYINIENSGQVEGVKATYNIEENKISIQGHLTKQQEVRYHKMAENLVNGKDIFNDLSGIKSQVTNFNQDFDPDISRLTQELGSKQEQFSSQVEKKQEQHITGTASHTIQSSEKITELDIGKMLNDIGGSAGHDAASGLKKSIIKMINLDNPSAQAIYVQGQSIIPIKGSLTKEAAEKYLKIAAKNAQVISSPQSQVDRNVRDIMIDSLKQENKSILNSIPEPTTESIGNQTNHSPNVKTKLTPIPEPTTESIGNQTNHSPNVKTKLTPIPEPTTESIGNQTNHSPNVEPFSKNSKNITEQVKNMRLALTKKIKSISKITSNTASRIVNVVKKINKKSDRSR